MARVRMCGIYIIENSVSLSVYVGQSVDIKKRVDRHFRQLSSGTHINRNLQGSFDNDGRDVFTWRILEEVDNREDLTLREEYWIEYYRGKMSVCNIAEARPNNNGPDTSEAHKKAVRAARKKAGQYWSEAHKASVIAVVDIVSPEGVVFRTTDGIRSFCREHKLNNTRVMDLISGRFKQHNGWHLPGSKEKARIKYSLLSPTGEVHLITDAFREFAKFRRKYNLDESCLYRLRSGEKASYKGWTWYERE